jgi:hypothetical protein
VHEGVGLIQFGIDDIRATLGRFSEHFVTAGQTTFYARPPEVLRTMGRAAREALARDHQAPQIINVSRLSGSDTNVENDPELAAELQASLETILAFQAATWQYARFAVAFMVVESQLFLISRALRLLRTSCACSLRATR